MRAFCWACVLASVLAFSFACGQSATQVRELSAEELAKLLEQPDKVFFLDVREPYEIQMLGSVKGYVNIPMSQLPARLREIPKNKVIVTL
jgi:rhodanese-related sulfurtransferase